MKKIITLILTIAVLTVCLLGCEDSNETEIEIKQKTNQAISIWIDEETGVQYIIYGESWGYSGGAGITPRLNADGSLYIASEEGGAEG